MKNIKKTIAAALVSIALSASASAGTWGAPAKVDTFRATQIQSFASLAGTSYTSQVSGYCTTGSVRDYYTVVTGTCAFRACNYYGTVYRQTCI